MVLLHKYLRNSISLFSGTVDRIVGGTGAQSGQFPYLTSVRTLTGTHYCGGAIISSRCVLTAAHCVVDKVVLNMKIVTGTNSLTSGGSSYSVIEIKTHPNFNAYTLFNDIAVLKTSSNIQFNELVNAIELGTAFVNGDISTFAIGWGQTSVK